LEKLENFEVLICSAWRYSRETIY